MAKVTIVGAGLSGMTTAAILAAEGHEVLVLEREKKIGGAANMHPSVHTTPVDFVNLERLTGLDFRGLFKPLKRLTGAFLEDQYEFDPLGLYSVERGPRPSSIDTFLYKICRERGVKFQFSTEIKNPFHELPQGSILASGLVAHTIQALGIPNTNIYGYGGLKKTKDESVAYIYFDQKCADDYVYGTAENGIWYSLLFNRMKAMTPEQLRMGQELTSERMGIEYEQWTEFVCTVVMRHNLLVDGYIMAGTASGTCEPLMGFGIHGAIVSGRPAAMAVTDPQGALKLHNELNKNFWPGLIAWHALQAIPNKYAVLKFLFRHFRPGLLLLSMAGKGGVPGYNSNDYLLNAMKSVVRIK